jgi:predicted nuclease of restriction endonuclease-like (RecB) superfamily
LSPSARERLQSHDQHLWYIKKTIESGWGQNVLVHWMESDLRQRQGKAQTNEELEAELKREPPAKIDFRVPSIGSSAA